ncbi:hypothetical protein PISMIDRAFT_685690, partial [Pisolithus microcarpus 441]
YLTITWTLMGFSFHSNFPIRMLPYCRDHVFTAPLIYPLTRLFTTALFDV